MLDRSRILGSFGTTGLVVLLSLVTSILLARFLAPEGRGLLLALAFWPSLIAALLNISLNESTTYHIASREGASGNAFTASLVDSALVLQCVIALAATLVCLTALPFIITGERAAHLSTVVLYAIAFAPLTILSQHFRAVLQGQGKFHTLNILRSLQAVCYLAGLLVMVVFEVATVEHALLAMVTALSAVALTGGLLVGLSFSGASRSESAALLRTGVRFHRANVLLYGAAEADKFIVLVLLTNSEAGLFAVALAYSSIGAGIVTQTIHLLVSREMAMQATSKGREEVFTRMLRLAVLILATGSAAAAIVAPHLIPLLFGETFEPAVLVSLFLLIAASLKALRQIMDRAMRALHITRVGIVGEGVTLAALLALGPVFIAHYGLVGIAYATVAAQMCSFVIAAVMACRIVEVSPTAMWPFHRSALADVRSLLVTPAKPDDACPEKTT